MARAAQEAGADLLKVHINVRHLASGTIFGSLAEERDRLAEILAVGLPTGVVPGEEAMVTPDELLEIRMMGFAFLDAFVHVVRPFLYSAGLPVVPALPHSIERQYLDQVRALPGEWVEAAIVPPAGYGKSPVEEDYAALRIAAEGTAKRLIVPTQRQISPADLPRYFEVPAVEAVTIGAIVTGMDARSLGRATRAFRRALDHLAA